MPRTASQSADGFELFRGVNRTRGSSVFARAADVTDAGPTSGVGTKRTSSNFRCLVADGGKRTSSSDAVTSKKWAQEWSWHHLPKEQAIYNQLFGITVHLFGSCPLRDVTRNSIRGHLRATCHPSSRGSKGRPDFFRAQAAYQQDSGLLDREAQSCRVLQPARRIPAGC
jgi:hypothetical protein